MASKLSYFLLVVLCILGSAASHKLIESDTKIASPKAMTRLVTQLLSQDTDVSTFANEKEQSCFDNTKEKESEVNTQYNNAWVLCSQSATDSKNAITKEMQESRNDLITRGKSVSNALSECESISDGLQFLSCINKASSEYYPQLFKISVNSSSLENSVRAKYEQITYAESECTSLAFYKFVTDLSEVIQERQKCLKSESSSNSL